MLKFVLVAVVVAFAVGIMVGSSASSDSAQSGEQVLNNAVPANADVPLPGNASPNRGSAIGELDAKISLLQILESSIAERSYEYDTLIAEIARLLTVKTTLEEDLGESVFAAEIAVGR